MSSNHRRAAIFLEGKMCKTISHNTVTHTHCSASSRSNKQYLQNRQKRKERTRKEKWPMTVDNRTSDLQSPIVQSLLKSSAAELRVWPSAKLGPNALDFDDFFCLCPSRTCRPRIKHGSIWESRLFFRYVMSTYVWSDIVRTDGMRCVLTQHYWVLPHLRCWAQDHIGVDGDGLATWTR